MVICKNPFLLKLHPYSHLLKYALDGQPGRSFDRLEVDELSSMWKVFFFFLKRPWKIFHDCHNDQHPFKTYNSILLPGDLKKKALCFENIQNTCPKIHCIRSKCCHSHPIAKM